MKADNNDIPADQIVRAIPDDFLDFIERKLRATPAENIEEVALLKRLSAWLCHAEKGKGKKS